MNFTVTHCRMLSASIKEVRVVGPVPAAAMAHAGAHFKWRIPGLDDCRHYSTVHVPEVADDQLIFAIRLSADSVSSQYIRALKIGDQVELEGPFNSFAYPLDVGSGRDIAIAGGIGITPLTGILRHLKSLGRDPQLHYFAKSSADAAYAEHLQDRLRERMHLHLSGARPAIAQLLADLSAEDRLYVCGPASMLSDVLSHAQRAGLPRENIHLEVFNLQVGDAVQGCVIDAADSGISVSVAPGQSLLDALEAAGLDPLYDCRRGECGVCALDVLEGEVDHRDFIMSAQEAACSARIYPCVSRAKSPRLKLAI
ncbi:iron-sulfur cluster-binding domain-containing protein [Pseudomonas sp. SWRI99]|uniref:flavin reductase family protein n=1 Tax=Pseudomonas sp. SWRI99 TaxID=2745506 RepID=UPI0016476404|nr:iron-sulfur cluster-binding domain-containing protein [Pseudomonas sp. SWRI99]MBC3775625.1 iron-sulfur cluster-binding domain-containing protein [Pseudomonas sp. SWRI99]